VSGGVGFWEFCEFRGLEEFESLGGWDMLDL